MNIPLSRVLKRDELDQVTAVKWQMASEIAEPVAAANLVPSAAPSQALPDNVDHERREREAYQRGFGEGRATGRDQSAAEVQIVVDRLTRSINELSGLRSKIRKEAESDLIKLAIAVARRVLHRELTLDPESIGGLIRVALEKLDGRELYRVRVHPNQEMAVHAAIAHSSGSQKVEIIPDPVLQCGDVLFETPQGTLDASIEVQLNEIERGFADRLRR